MNVESGDAMKDAPTPLKMKTEMAGRKWRVGAYHLSPTHFQLLFF